MRGADTLAWLWWARFDAELPRLAAPCTPVHQRPVHQRPASPAPPPSADAGWSAAASATPAIMLAAGAGFFGMSLAANQGISVAGLDPAAMAVAGVAAGAITQVRAQAGGACWGVLSVQGCERRPARRTCKHQLHGHVKRFWMQGARDES